MSDAETGPAPAADRLAWLRNLRRVNERQEDALAADFDAHYGQIEPTHRAFVERLLQLLPPRWQGAGRGLRYRQVLPDDAGQRSPAAGGRPRRRLPGQCRHQVPPGPHRQHDLQDLPYHHEFDGVLCVDAMEFVPPEDWPVVLGRFRRALRSGGWLYLTVELAPDDRVRAGNQAARRAGLPVVDGEVIWDEPDGYYHHYPTMPQVRAWLADAGFVIEQEAAGPWHAEEYAYHHVLARLAAPPG